MHSSLIRLQSVFGLFSSAALCLVLLIVASSFVTPQHPTGVVRLDEVSVHKSLPHARRYSAKEQFAHIKFDIDVDVSSLFHWNTKQVFLYVKAVYPSLKSSRRTAADPSAPPALREDIIWDAILPSRFAPDHENYLVRPGEYDRDSFSLARRGPGRVQVQGQLPRYRLVDPAGSIERRGNVTLQLGWQIQPWVGLLTPRLRSDFGAWKALEGEPAQPFEMPPLDLEAPRKRPVTVEGNEKNRGRPV